VIGLLSAVALGLAAGAASAQAATTVTVAPNTPLGGSQGLPFGTTVVWPAYLGFIYKDVPPFQLKKNDKLAFDLSEANNVPIQLVIELAPTAVNGGDTAAGAFTPVVPNTQQAADPDGNTLNDDFELEYTAQAPFNFAGGGLIIRFSDPGGAFASDAVANFPLTNMGSAADASGFFVGRFYGDPDGVPPYENADAGDVSAFRVSIQDPVPGKPKKKCKKKRKKKGKSAAAAAKKKKKKCKKKRKGK
jgi:hypothetical protein